MCSKIKELVIEKSKNPFPPPTGGATVVEYIYMIMKISEILDN